MTNVGKSGLKISALSYGSRVTFHTQAGEDKVYQLISKAYDHRVIFFDNAEAYADGNAKIIMGKVLIQTFLLLPRMTKRVIRIIDGEKLEKSLLHVYFAAAELVKVSILICLGFNISVH